MKVSLNWLKEMVDVDVSIDQLAQLFNIHSAEVEEYYRLVDIENLVVGYVKERVMHPDADKLSICQVDLGDEVSQIICGAPNVREGQYVIVTKPGAVLPNGMKIKKATIRGVESNGMICSLVELGIDKKFANEDGIYVIKEECKAGDNPLEVLHLNDQVLALDLTPNRADLLSMMGVAYDTAAILEKEVQIVEPVIEEIDEENDVKIKLDTEHCSAYYARVIKDIEIKESPRWMQSRLIAAGIRPISNVVDITNYVMLHTGQPLHAFDYDRLESNEIVVRLAKEKEELTTLDNQKRILQEEDIVITNGSKAVALGGVMGGLETEIESGSKSVLLESAIFDPYFIRKTSSRLDLRSESSMRFERQVDPNRTKLALELATELFIKYASGKALKGISYVDNADHDERFITVTTDKINQVLGTNYETRKFTSVLDRLKYNYEVVDNNIGVYAPTRKQDCITYQDLIEEIGRIIGYDSLPTTIPETVSVGTLSDLQLFQRKVRSTLTGLGLNEAVTYSLVNKDNLFELTKNQSEIVPLLMPMSADRNVLIKTPLNGLLEAIKYNVARKQADVAFFEIGKGYYPDHEQNLLSGALTGVLSDTLWQGKKEIIDFYIVKGLLESLFDVLEVSHLTFEPMSDYENLHPGQSAYIKDRTGVVGFIGKLHPEYARKQSLKDVYVFELDMDKLYEVRRPLKRVKDVNKYPSMYRDIAIVVDKGVIASNVIDAINKAGKRMLVNTSIFDLYQGENVEENEKSLAVRLEFTDPKRTLETKEVDERVNEILRHLEKEFNAKLR